MTRRELIQKTTLALGYTISAPTLMGILGGCEPKHAVSYTPVFFTDEQAVLIGDLAEIILPRTSTAGAKDAGVPAFIDSFIKEVYPKQEQERFLAGLKKFNEGTVDRFLRLFTECTLDTQVLYTNDVHKGAIKNIQDDGWAAKYKSDGWWGHDKSERPFILQVKELTILGFFTSEQGSTKVLKYNPAPGPFKGCVPLSESLKEV